MSGGQKADVVVWWVRLAETEPNEETGRDWAGLVKDFADRVGCLDVWSRALEGWNVWKFKLIKEWQTEGRTEGQKQSLLRMLDRRFPG